MPGRITFGVRSAGTPYLYYVALPDVHTCSRTLAEHETNKESAIYENRAAGSCRQPEKLKIAALTVLMPSPVDGILACGRQATLVRRSWEPGPTPCRDVRVFITVNIFALNQDPTACPLPGHALPVGGMG